MKIRKDKKLDVAYIQLRRGKVAKTIEFREGILIDLDKKGRTVGIEVLSVEKLAPALGAHRRKERRRVA